MSGLFSRLFGNDNANPISSTNPLPVTTYTPTDTPANSTSVSAASLPTVSTNVPFTAASNNFTLTNNSALLGSILYVSLISPATTTSYAIQPQTTFTYAGASIIGIWIIGSAATGGYSLFAH